MEQQPYYQWDPPPFPHRHNHLDFPFDVPPSSNTPYPPFDAPPPTNRPYPAFDAPSPNPPFLPFNAPPPDPFPIKCGGVGGGGAFNNPSFLRKRKFDGPQNSNYVKLYAGNIPRGVPEEEVRHLFEEHGNVIEVVLLTDKKSGLRQEYCFVKYASIEEAERAIVALNDQFSFPGAMYPLRVRYADGERKRPGLDHFVPQDSPLSRSVPGPMQHGPPFSSHSVQGQAHHGPPFSGPVSGETEHKVFVAGLNREASKEEIQEIFSSYGDVVDIFIMRDEFKRNRDCGFVGFSHRYMAEAAINGLHGNFVMRGCAKPLIVRFASPKKPKIGDTRSAPSSADTRRNNLSNALHLGNSSICAEFNSTGLQPGISSPVANQSCVASCEIGQPLSSKPFSPSLLSQMSLQEPRFEQKSSQSSRQLDSQSQSPVHLNQNGVTERQHVHQSPQALRDHDVNSAMPSSGPVSCAISGGDFSETLIDCDWSEHICPDGHKYYFNSVTCDSKWEKPEEFVIYERKLQKQQLQYRYCDKPSEFSTAEAPPREGDFDNEMARDERKPFDSEKLLLSVPCAVEHSNEQVQVGTCSLGQPALVQ